MSKVYFKTNTLLKNLIGKDLINDDNIGVIELIKNSYDAHASLTQLIFKNLNSGRTDDKSQIIIIDNGHGMNWGDINEKWLNIAYSEKKNTTFQEGVSFAGNKGIGRFSCDRLGEVLDMFTRKENGDLLHLHVDWLDFEKEDQIDLIMQKVGVSLSITTEAEVKTLTEQEVPVTGTLLMISGLRSTWHKESILALKRDLEKFMNPNHNFQNTEFSIELICEYFKEEDRLNDYSKAINGVVKNLVFDKLKFKSTYIESKISKNGQDISTELFHEGECVFSILEKNDKFSTLKNIEITIYFLNAYKKSYFKRQTGISTIDFGSIFLFLNGFRVSPYGERGDDWLGLDSRKAQGHSRYLGNRDVIGRVVVSDHDDLFKPISSREGLKNTSALECLRDEFFFNVLKRLEKFVINGLDWDSVPKKNRLEIDLSKGLDWDNTSEMYTESWEKKKRRISMTIVTLIGTSKDRIKKIWFNTRLMNSLVEQKNQELQEVISSIEGFDKEVIDDDLRSNLKKISNVIKHKSEEVRFVKGELTDLQLKAEESKSKIKNLTNDAKLSKQVIATLESKTEQFESQTLFLKSIGNLDSKMLLGYHHQICLDSSIIDNYVARAIKALKNEKSIDKALSYLQKISIANKKITATAQYATKANFKSGSKRELTDLPLYFEQYLNNVAKEFSASSLNLHIQNNLSDKFEIVAKKIELSILIDNLISNANKANSKNLSVVMNLLDKERLEVLFKDDGVGLTNKVADVNNFFEIGVTTTSGSGLGLYHVKEILDSLSATIELLANNPKGVIARMVFIR